MEPFFESMAEAVSTVVLLATDCEENEKLAHTLLPAAKVVQQCAGTLSQIGEEVAGQWRRALDDVAMSQRTSGACAGVSQAGAQIVRACERLAEAPKDLPNKKLLTQAAKDILINTTQLLQLADLYESLKLVKYAEAVLNVVGIFVDQVSVMSDFGTVAQDVSLGSVETCKLVALRLRFISHEGYQRRLEAALAILKTQTEALIVAEKDFLTTHARGVRDAKASEVRYALEEIIEVTKLSSRDLMDRLNLNFDPLLREKVKQRLDTSGLDNAAKRLGDLLKKLVDDVNRKDRPAAEQTLRDLAQLGPVPDSLKTATYNALDHPSREALRKLQQECARLQALRTPPEGDKDYERRKAAEKDLNDALNRLRKALDKMGQAVDQGQREEAIAAAKDVAAQLQKADEQAAKVAALYDHDPERQRRIQTLRDDVKQCGPALLAAAKNALANPNDPDALRRLQDALDRARRALRNLQDAASTPSHQEIKQIERAVDAQLDAIPPLALEGKVGDASEKARVVGEQIQRAANIATGAAPHTAAPEALNDPFRRKLLDEALARLKKANDALQNTTGKAAQAPQHEPAQKALHEAIGDTRGAMDRLVQATDQRPEEALVDNATELDKALDSLNSRAAAGNRDGAAADADRARELAGRQAALAEKLAESHPEAGARERLRALGPELVRAVDDAARQGDKTAQTPAAQRAAEAARLADAVKTAKDVNHELVDAALNPEEALAAERERMRREMENLDRALKAGDREAATKALEAIKDSMAKQRILAKALALKCPDAKQRQRLLDAALSMQEAVAGVIEAAIKALNSEGPLGPPAQWQAQAQKVREALQGWDGALAGDQQAKEGMDAAASEMQAATQGLVADQSTPEGKLFGLAKLIADEMAKLSAASKSGQKQEIIRAAKQIAALVQKVQEHAAEAAARCADPRLASPLKAHAQAARNVATQLKILCAVKAATAEEDPTVKAQLVRCAKTLASEMMKTVHHAEITKLKAKK